MPGASGGTPKTGRRTTFHETGRMRVASLATLESLVFTRPESSFLRFHGELGTSLKTGPARTSLVAGADLTLHAAGLESTPTVALAYDRPRWGLESKVYFPSGELRNDVGYNWDKSPYASLGVRTTLGGDKPAKRPYPKALKPPQAAY